LFELFVKRVATLGRLALGSDMLDRSVEKYIGVTGVQN
jgi:hypothetical protein